ncbi:MAG: hypothetical protein SGPRY_011491, partial [Prymnesium sp.]
MLATAASFVLVSVAQIAGAEGATTAVWVYVIVCIFALLHTLYTSDGISRALLFWRLVGRMILHYKLVRLWGRHSDLEAPELEGVYAQLHQRYAPRVHAPLAVLELILQLRGFYIKLGQASRRSLATLLSLKAIQHLIPPAIQHRIPPVPALSLIPSLLLTPTPRNPPTLELSAWWRINLRIPRHPHPNPVPPRISTLPPRIVARHSLLEYAVPREQVVSVIDMVPEDYRKELAVLQSGVPPKPAEQVYQIIAAELGKPVGQLFTSFDDTPLGSASIGQVHRAKLKDGREVVVKVQYEEVRRLFATDFSQLQAACYFWTPQAMSEMREMRAQFMAEFDFRREGRVMSQIADNLAAPFPRVAVPRPIAGMVSENVLVMTYLPGSSLLDAIKRMAQAMLAPREALQTEATTRTAPLIASALSTFTSWHDCSVQ